MSKKKSAITKGNVGTELVDVQIIAAQLEELTDPRKVKAIADRAEALSVFFRRSEGGLAAVNHAIAIALRADRRLGELLKDFKRGRGRPKTDADADEKMDPGAIFVIEQAIPGKRIKRWQQLAQLEIDIFEAYIASAQAKGKKITFAGAVGAKSAESGYDSDEWYTPAKYVEAARRVLGEIDIDPATCQAAQQRVGARQFFTKEDSGLSQSWFGRVWLNPPFSSGTAWADKLLEEWDSGQTSAAIMLQNSCTDTGWFHRLAGNEDALCCFTEGRIAFEQADGTASNQNRQGQVFVCLGDDEVHARFRDVFGAFGLVGKLASAEVDGAQAAEDEAAE